MRSDDENAIQADLHRLAGSIPHRGPNTESERVAADYVASRMRETTPDVGFEDFESIDGYLLLFAGYYSEFLLVALLAQWFPYLAAVYGAGILIAYLAEFTGYRVVSRLMPRYQSQNVVARFLADRPRRTYVITAHYDSGRSSALSEHVNRRRFHWIHRGLVAAMAIAVIGCLMLGANLFPDLPFPVGNVLLCAAMGVLTAAAAYLFFAELTADYVRGALDNASGVAALLALGRWLQQKPLEEADVWLVATGSKEGWMSGMLHHIGSHDFDKSSTCFINFDHLGAPALRFVTDEGMLARFSCDPAMVDIARRTSLPHGATPYAQRGLPTDLLIPLTRGYRAIGVTSTEVDGTQPHRLQETDTLAQVSPGDVQRAVAFTQDFILALDESLRAEDRVEAPSSMLR
jgi:hypothetical protein